MIENNLRNLLNEVNDKLFENDIKNIAEFIDNQEWGLAYELFCTQIYEYNIPITEDFYTRISRIGKLIDVSPNTWTPLRCLIE